MRLLARVTASFFYPLFRSNPNPVSVKTATICFGTGLYRNEAELCSNPFALTHVKDFATISKRLAIGTIREPYLWFAFKSLLVVLLLVSIEKRYLQAKIYILVDDWLVEDLMLSSWF